MNDDLTPLGLFRWSGAAGIGLGLLIIIPTTLGLMALPAWLAFERDALTESHQYVEARESMLLQWIAAYEGLDDGPQRQALLDRIRLEASRLSDPPEAVTRFLEEHP